MSLNVLFLLPMLATSPYVSIDTVAYGNILSA